MDKFELTVLGSGSATPTPERNPAGQLLNIREELFLIDCGEGTQVALRRYKIRIQRIGHIFISHLHGDHYLGLPGLLATYILLGRTKPLKIYGPEGLDEFIDTHFRLSQTTPGFKIDFKAVHTGTKKQIFSGKTVSIYAFPLNHRIETYGYLFAEKSKPRHIKSEAIRKYGIPHEKIREIKAGRDFYDERSGNTIANEILTSPPDPVRKFAYCSDTAWSSKIAKWIRGADMVYHETTFMEKDRELAEKTFHSTTLDAARTALAAGAGQLLIGHYSSRYQSARAIETECRTLFENTRATNDGDVITVP